MKKILELIEHKKQEFAQLPIFEFLQNNNIDPRQRLAFVPCMTHFIISFSEINKYFFREEPTNDPIQALVNAHSYEDDHHYLWYYEDLEKLGLNKSRKYVDTLKFIWGKENKKSRQLSYKLAAHAYKSNPVLKLAVIEVIEATGNVFLSITAGIAEELQKITGENYRYFGKYHVAVETGHAMGTFDVETLIENIDIPPEIQDRACQLVEEVFAAFTEMVDEWMAYIKAHKLDQSLLAA